jgi:murein DD-endopeptidase
MPEMPTLGNDPKKSVMLPVVLGAVAFGVVVGAAYWLTHRGPAEPMPVAAASSDVVDAGVLAVTDATTADGGSPTPRVAAAEAGPFKTLQISISGPLESAIVAAAGKDVGNPLTQVVNRSLVWWLRVPQDLVKGDQLSVVYEVRESQEPLVHAVRFTSRKLGKTFEAWRFQPKDAPFARFFQTDGSELEERLVDGPLDHWEQITSLLRDGRKHKGVDFKTPVGTPVRATFDGTITRKNWNFRGNGNSLEVEERGGQRRSAMFLHLSELPKTVQAGQHVKKGEVIAKTGNTGHSFAPHLHYQLMKGETVIDPFTSHQTTRAHLPVSDRAAFEAQIGKYRALLPVDVVAGG